MRALTRLGLIAVVTIVAVMPGIAHAVRPSFSPTSVGLYRGSDTAGTVGFTLQIDDDVPPTGDPGALSAWNYQILGIRIAAKCSSSGPLRPRGEIIVPGSRFHTRQRLHFDRRLGGVVFRGMISGRLNVPDVRGTVQVLKRGCDHAVMPFTAAIFTPPSAS